MVSVYVWCEDSGSGYMFWREIFGIVCPGAIVESKPGNSRLRREVGRIQPDGNEYYILIDTAADNPDVLRELMKVRRDAAVKPNVKLIEVHCFEYVLLSFERLEQWVFAAQDELKDKRRQLLDARRFAVSGGSARDLEQFKAAFPYALSHNSEQICAQLLYEITRNTGFETDKGSLGPCFTNDCCSWAGRKSDDICGLDFEQLSAFEKKRQLIEYSILKPVLARKGLI